MLLNSKTYIPQCFEAIRITSIVHPVWLQPGKIYFRQGGRSFRRLKLERNIFELKVALECFSKLY